jgi:Asp-tRNA(Asn)/Glu-tRNA(Gln) amidotransferase A subunit family amidase
LPAITVPCGFSSDRLKLGVQFLGRALNDGAVIAAAPAFQSHSDWHTKHPPMA